jgi:hypothetical protein
VSPSHTRVQHHINRSTSVIDIPSSPVNHIAHKPVNSPPIAILGSEDDVEDNVESHRRTQVGPDPIELSDDDELSDAIDELDAIDVFSELSSV